MSVARGRSRGEGAALLEEESRLDVKLEVKRNGCEGRS